MEKQLKAKVEDELTELFNTGEIKNGYLLAKEIGEKIEADFYLNNKVYPGYNFLNLYKDTVFCHLNPGGDPDPVKFKSELIETCPNAQTFIDKYIALYNNYARERFIDKKEFDNFDFKQALYLSGFPNNGVEFYSKDEPGYKNKEKQSLDCHNVLTQKTQLELIPYQSRKFSNIFNSQKQSDKVINIIKPYFEELLSIITLNPRKYSIFGSAQYEQILISYDRINPIIIEKSDKYGFDIGVAKKAYFRMYKLRWNDKEFFAGIAHSFARQDLPNAYIAMKRYGELSFEKYLEFINKYGEK